VAIDRNLQRLRDLTLDQLGHELAGPGRPTTRDDRASCVLQAALHDVDTHHWSTEITPDGARLRLAGGSVSLDLGLSRTLMHFIEDLDGHWPGEHQG
jgi:hypothetical protein